MPAVSTDIAAGAGAITTLNVLKNNGAAIGAGQSPTKSPLLTAIENGRADVVRWLLDTGINPSVTFKRNNAELLSAFKYAKEQGGGEALEILDTASRDFQTTNRH